MPSIASKNTRARILIVEDDPVMAGSLVELFTMDGYQAAVAKNGSTAKAKLQELHPDLVILDLMLPDIDGLVLCSELSRAAVPFIVCSGTNRQRDRILARRLGADDFIAKPFDMYEFEARVAAVLRRSVTADQTRRTDQANEPRAETGGVTQELRVGEMLLSRSRSAVTITGQEVRLTTTEHRLVCALAERPNEAVSRAELADLVWGYRDTAAKGRTLDVHVAHVRRKLGRIAAAPRIVPVRGYGYEMVSNVPSSLAAAT